MDVKALHRQMTQYNLWKQQLDERLQRFDEWGQSHQMLSSEALQTLQKARKLLQGNTFTIACVGEFSRGKTELINALLYADGAHRLLPSLPGRTTMCPTEIFWEADQPINCVRLLPIETRRTNASMQNFKRIPQNWVTIPFDPRDQEQARAAINQVSASKWVTTADALKLGFALDELGEQDESGKVAVPAWRHALISLDHPLLRQGLRIVDTPGLNALGNEPELTLKTLPEAQAILFLLAADAGVTASDMSIWREHVQSLRDEQCTAVLVLLNKIDSLWDDLQPPADIEANIERIRLLTARQLKLTSEQVLAISAKQGLLGKIGRNLTQQDRSNFPTLERKLADVVMHSQQQIVGHRLVGDSYEMIMTTRHSLARRLSECETEIAIMRRAGPSAANDVLQQLRDTIRQSHHQYHKQALSLRTSQRLLDAQRVSLLAPISAGLLEQQINSAQRGLAQSWTSLGLGRAISNFFDDVDSSLRHIEREIERSNRVLVSIYQRPEHGLNSDELMMRHLLKIHIQRRQLKQLSKRADDFRYSLSTLLTRKSVLITRFINSLVQEVRNTYKDLSEHIDLWIQEALSPLIHGNQYQKQLLEKHMLRLTQLQNKRNSHSEQIESLQTNIYQLQAALASLEPLYQDIMSAPLTAEKKDNIVKVKRGQVVSLAGARQAVKGS
ncbi:MAG: dynamin family protein [Pseudomonadota bacterium]